MQGAQAYVLAIVIGYILGSIPSAIWICRLAFGIDITQVGSGNPGMTNVWRTLGWKPALPVALLDAAKGFFAAWIGLHLATDFSASQYLAIAAGIAAVVGHSLSFLARFKGGKSVLTTFGVFLALSPIASLTALLAWILVMVFCRIVSLSSLTAALVLPPMVLAESHWRGRPAAGLFFFVALGMALFVVFRHRGNIQRLVQGTEKRFGRSTS